VGYLYARLLQEKLKVPVGIIASAYGGTPIEAWMTSESLKDFTSVKIPSTTNPPAKLKNQPTVLYNAMIHPAAGYGIRGFLWYQGEANARNPHMYADLMASMVKGWRAQWNNNRLPFYFVQIAPFNRKDSTNASTRVREAQLKALDLIPLSGMAVTLDVGEENQIHPSDKSNVARRLYQLALAKTYGHKNVAWSGPVFRNLQIKGDTAQLRFDLAGKGLTDKGKGLTRFEVAGTDRVFHPAKATITPYGIAVWSPEVKSPQAVRYAFKDWVVGDLYNMEGLPASSFRTDNW
jgi:sialate O-acetylesterase